jgi:hypothetical protein
MIAGKLNKGYLDSGKFGQTADQPSSSSIYPNHNDHFYRKQQKERKQGERASAVGIMG